LKISAGANPAKTPRAGLGEWGAKIGPRGPQDDNDSCPRGKDVNNTLRDLK